MSMVLAECREIMIAAEMCTVHSCFKKWLVERKVVPRVATTVLEAELHEFESHLAQFYRPSAITGSLTEQGTVEQHLNNMALRVMNEGAYRYCAHVRNVIGEVETDRISLNKFIKMLDAYADVCLVVQTTTSKRI